MSAPFVTFEGIEGSGKTTQIRRLSDYLKAKGTAHIVTREPGGTPLANEIRALLLSPREEAVLPATELLLYEAARAQHVRAVILPALAAGTAVLCDRFCDATLAYQGFSRGIDASRVEWLNAFAAAGVAPDLTVLLDVAPEEGFRRIAGRGRILDRLEGESLAFHRQVRGGYLSLFRRHPERIVLVDGAGSPDAVFDAVRAATGRFGW